MVDYNNNCKYDESDSNFTVLEATPKMTYPNGGESFNWGDVINVTWNQATFYSDVRIDYSTDSGATWVNYLASTTNDGSQSCQIPWITSSKCLFRVSNTANLNSNDYSDAVFNIKAPVTLITPNGGQVLKGCSTQTISFTAPPNISAAYYYYMYYTTDGGANYNYITALSYSSSGSYSYTWNIPNGINSTQCKIKVESYYYPTQLADSSNNFFTINPSNSITVTYPNGGEQIQSLTNKTITWTADATTSGSYNVLYSVNGGASYSILATNIAAKSYTWTFIPNNPATTYKIKVVDYNNTCKYDESDSNFTVLETKPKMTYPNGGENLWAVVSDNITWNASTFYSDVRIDYSTDSGATWNVIYTSTPNDGSQSWSIPNVRSAKCLIKISNTADLNSYDISDAVFTINPVVRILTPNGGDSLGACTITSITFEKSPAYSTFDFYYSLDDGATYNNIAYSQSFTNTIGTYNWNIPNVNSNTVKVKVTPYYNNGYYDVSDVALSIKKPVNIIQPYYGGTIQAGSVFPIKWKSDGISNLYDIAYSTNGGTSWTNIVLGYNTSSNTYNWTVPNLFNSSCVIRVRDNINSCKEDISGTAFIIKAAANTINVTYPNGQEVLNGCQNINITWSETITPIGLYDIYYTTDGTKTWTPIVQNYSTTSGSYNWTIPANINSQKVLVKVYNANNWAVYDQSDAAFTLKHIITSQTGDFGGCNSVTVFGNIYTSSTSINDTLKNMYGCDSVYRDFAVNIQNITPVSIIGNWFGCNSYLFNGKTYTTSTQIKDTVKTIFGCDSLYRINNISIQKITATTQSSSLFGCNNVMYKGITYTTNTTVKDTLKTILGCDSIYTIKNIVIQTINPTSTTLDLFGCNSVVFNGKTYTLSSTIYDTLKTTKGCDSIYRTANIIVQNITPTSVISNLSGCKKVVYNGITYTITTTIRDTIKTTLGCDSVYNIANIIVQNTTPTIVSKNLVSCGSVLYNGITYTTSTIIKDTTKTILGCDSIYSTINITVNTAPTRDTVATVCNSLNWYGTLFKNDTTATHTIKAITIDSLKEGFANGITPPNGWTFTQIAGTYTSAGNFGAASPSLKFGTNNDQIISPTLASNATQLSFWIKSQGASGSSLKIEGYNGTNWITVNNITTFPATGTIITYNQTSTPILPVGLTKFRFTYTKSIGNVSLDDLSILYKTNNGCDSLITLHLTTKKAVSTSTSPTVCNKYIYKNITYGSSAIIKDTLKAIGGCDSVYLTINLTINPTISGRVIHQTKGAISNVLLTAKNTNIVDSAVINGSYIDSCLSPQSNISIKLKKNNDKVKANGINTTDVLLVQRHILNTTKITNPYKLIAADVNGDGKINSTDILRIKRLILGSDTTFTKGSGANKVDRLWEFVDSAYVFPDSTNPFPFKDSISFINLASTKINQTFIGVKLGDVSYDWNPVTARGAATKPVEFIYTTKNQESGMGNSIIRIPITANNFKELVAMQYTMHFNNKDYEFVAIENNKIGIDFNDKQAMQTGDISFLWTDKNANEKTLNNGTELFVLVLQQKGIGNLELAINDAITDVSAWDKDFNQHDIILTKREILNEQLVIRNELFSVSPNPTTGIIKVDLIAKANKTIRFELSSLVGKTITQQTADLQKGNNTITINLKKNGTLATGIYFLKAVGLEGDNVKRIVVQ